MYFLKNQIERAESRLFKIQKECVNNQYFKCIQNVSIAIQGLKSTCNGDLLDFLKSCSHLQLELSKLKNTIRLLFIVSNLTLSFEMDDENDTKQDCNFLNESINLFSFSNVPIEFHLLVVQQLDMFYSSKAYEWLDKPMILQLAQDLKLLYELDFTFLSYFHQVEESSLIFKTDIHQSKRTRIVIANSSTHNSIAVTYHNIPLVDHSFTNLVKLCNQIIIKLKKG